MEPVRVLAPTPIYPRYSGGTTYAHIIVEFKEYDGKEAEYFSSWGENRTYSRLKIRCQIDSDTRPHVINESHSYGWDLVYEDYSRMVFREIEQAYKDMKPIHNRYEKLKEQWGQPQSFGHFVMLMAQASKTKYIVLPGSNSLISLLDGATWIDNKVVELKQQCLDRLKSA
jgi:hypothetical protein